MPVRDNLHGDIGQIKRWTAEQGDGNYLVQKEGLYYHVWVTPKIAGSGKKLPEDLHLVYQSNWGGYLSIYKLD
jgi:hydroxylamine oxidation protein HaoB